MAMMGFREYARHRGVSPEAVSKAVRTGRISTTKDQNGNRKIDPEIADKEWSENTATKRNHEPGDIRMSSSKHDKMPDDPKPAEEPTPAQDATSESAEGEKPTETKPEVSQHSVTYAQSRSIKEAYSARLQRLSYEEKLGKLINVEKVRVAAFNTARIVRDSILNVPDRISHEIASITDPHEVHIRLSEALIEALEGLSGEFQSDNSNPE